MTAVETIPVALGQRAYEVQVGPRLLDHLGFELKRLRPAGRVIIVTDENVAGPYLERSLATLAAVGFSGEAITLPPGEASKSLGMFGGLVEAILTRGIDRGACLVALGGGVIGDLTGFAAAVLLRGIDFVQLPTSLLAQVDSSVGGKTGIDTPQGKNLVGAFHQPRLVLADTDTLATLPRRELLAGYAEVVKYGLINDPDFFAWLEQRGAAVIAGDTSARIEAVAHCVRAKARIVAADEREAGDRALLNLGHTFAHAFEAEAGFTDTLLHGEAVAIGLGCAFRLSARLGYCPEADVRRVERHLRAIGLPVDLPALAGRSWRRDAVIAQMQRDKKAKAGKLRFVLARGIGRAFVTDAVPPEALAGVLDDSLRVTA